MTTPKLPLSEYAEAVMLRMKVQRGFERTVSSRDWQQLRDWYSQGIPLSYVLEAVDDTFAFLIVEAPEEVSRVGLPYVATLVHNIWQERKELYVGAHEEES